MANTNIINAVFGSGLCAVTTSAFRANYGMVLRFSGIDLPTAFEVDFSNYDTSNNDSITAIGQNGEVQIPDQLWDSGLNIYAYVYLHPTDDSGVTVYTVTIPVLGRPNRTEEEPTPHEQTLIEQAISALNGAVEQTAADVETTTANAQAAALSEANAATSERSAAASAGAALASQNAAESAQRSATESATNASESARNAANSASQAAESATDAQASAEQAERSVQSIEGDVERSESAAATATEKATEASASASTASGKANEASASATAAAQSAQSAASAAQNAASSAQSAESSATDAEQAKTDAQDAQAAAEQAAQSISGLSEQIEQNTADIAELVQSKAGALIDTATGSIASFVPDATVPTVKGLTVDIEPVQSGSGDPSPDNIRPISGWDEVKVQRTGKNLWNKDDPTAVIGYYNLDGTFSPISTWRAIAFSCQQGFTYTKSGDGWGGIVTFWYDNTLVSSINASTVTVPSGVNNVRFACQYSSTNAQLELGSTATDYEPYQGDTYTIQLGQTVYGGTIDAVRWKMVVDMATVDLGTLAWMRGATNTNDKYRYYAFIDGIKTVDSPSVKSNLICSNYATETSNGTYLCRTGISGATDTRVWVYDVTMDTVDVATFKSAMNGVQLVYKLATPVTVDLTPLEISVLTGQTNNIWADSGNVSVEYAADLKTYINNKIAAAVAALS